MRSRILGVALAAAVAACSTRNPVRITLRDGRALTLTALVISGDTLIGLRGDPRRNGARVAAALAFLYFVASVST